MMRHIKMNLKNCLNIGSEDSALDYAFMYSVIEICRKSSTFALLHQKINVKINRLLFLALVEPPLNKGDSWVLWENRWLRRAVMWQP